MNQLSQKTIIDAHVLDGLRMCAQADDTHGNFQVQFYEAVDSLLNQHLRGLEFNVKRTVKHLIIENHFKADHTVSLTYYDVAKLLLSLELPTKQVITNFQNWILMSTEYALPYEDVIRVCLSEEFDHAADWENVLAELAPTTNETDTICEPDVPCEQEYAFEITQEDEPVRDLILDNKPVRQEKTYRIRYGMIAVYLVTLIGLGYGGLAFKQAIEPVEISFKDACILIGEVNDKPREMELIVKSVVAYHSPGYPSYLKFEPVNKERLKGYLKRRNSLLAEEPYFSTIIEASAIEDVHPALLFAITGQEQGFVKRGSANAALIVNNPFNVYHSWVEYNTNLKDTSRIAAQTIHASLADRPKGENPFKWMNKTYAEDPKWWQGTEHFFMNIEDYIGPYHFEDESSRK